MKYKLAYRVDDNGIFIEPVALYRRYDEERDLLLWDIPDDCIDSEEYPMPHGLYQPIRFTGEGWETTLTQEEIDEIIRNQPKPPPTSGELQQENELNAMAIMDLAGFTIGGEGGE